MTEPGRATLAEYIAYVRAKAARSEAARKARLEARPDRLARLKNAAEKRLRKRVKRIMDAATLV